MKGPFLVSCSKNCINLGFGRISFTTEYNLLNGLRSCCDEITCWYFFSSMLPSTVNDFVDTYIESKMAQDI